MKEAGNKNVCKCGTVLNDTDKMCPNCGRKKGSTSVLSLVILSIITLLFLIVDLFLGLCVWYLISERNNSLNETQNQMQSVEVQLEPTNEKTVTEQSKSSVDFRPYMIRLQQNIKSNWNPPRRNSSRRVVVTFKLGKDGVLLTAVKIIQSSGDEEHDQAAIDAIYATAPFDPLPEEYDKENIDIQFFFDYKVSLKDSDKKPE